MKHVVVDFEMNIINKQYREYRRVCGMEIIQIGAILLDEEYQEIGSFSTFVKPELNDEIEELYENLTGISTDMVQNAPCFSKAVYSFFSWIHTLDDEVEILAWSGNDLHQIVSEASIKDYDFNEYEERILENWYDFQDEFSHKLFLDYSCSLSDALQKSKLSFQGRQHDALYDARNTANLLALVRDEKRCLDTYGKVVEVQQVSQCTLGDLFDFSQFVFD